MHRILVNGAWVDALAPASRDIENPATREQLGTVPECAADDIARAVYAAKTAHLGWSALAASERAQHLHEIGAGIRARAPALAALLTQEAGKPLCESFDCVASAAACFESYAQIEPPCRDPPVLSSLPHRFDGVATHPRGVLAAILPFDFPLLRLAMTAAPALAQGNTLVCKPPRQNPLSTLMLAETCARLPPGVLNVITGGADAAMALAANPHVGSVSCADAAMHDGNDAAAAGTRSDKIARVPAAIEAIIVLKDADLDLAVPGVAWARLHNAGQSCTSSARIYVEAAVAAEFADRIHEYVAFLEVGDPLKRGTDLGPLISHEAVVRVGDQVAHAVKDGARLKLGGLRFRPWGLPGHFFQPTILIDVRRGRGATRAEILGPVLSIIPVADAEDAIRNANAEEGDLRASIYTRDPQLARQAMQAIQSGARWRSDAGGRDGHGAPPGDVPDASVEHIVARKPWWFPYRDRS